MSFTLGIELTKRCNFRCGHCFVDAGRPRRREAAAPAILGLLAEAARSGVTSVGWSGGEPLLFRDIDGLTAAATARGMRVGLVTNGYLATRARLSTLKEAGLRVVQVSLDGPDAARAKRYRRGPRQAFARALRAIEASVALDLTTYVCTRPTPTTAAEVDAMVQLTAKLGATGLRYTIFLPVGRARGRTRADADWATPEVAHFLRVVAKQATQRPRVLPDCPTGPLPGARRYVCTAGRETGYVTADGRLYPCTALMFPECSVGNVYEKPLGVLLNQGSFFKITRQMASRTPRGDCQQCDLRAACRSGCPGRTLAECGRIGGRGYRLSMPGCLYRLHPRPVRSEQGEVSDEDGS